MNDKEQAIEDTFKSQVQGIVSWQFSGVTNLSEPAYNDSLELIGEQVIEEAKKLGYRLPSPAPENLREQIKERLADYGSEVMARVQENRNGELAELTDEATVYMAALLQPYIEQAKREERKRIKQQIEYNYPFNRSLSLSDWWVKFWQALEQGVEEKGK